MAFQILNESTPQNISYVEDRALRLKTVFIYSQYRLLI